MEDIKLNLNEKGHGAFYIFESEQLAEMVISIADSKLTVYHTEVATKAEGKGLAKKLIEHMVTYAREHHLRVMPLCTFVHAQFKRHPDLYADVWEKSF
ncbi:MAG: GNAT family N-acetyltransferase [Chitinophagaceae bacterium]